MSRTMLMISVLVLVGLCTAQLNFSPNWGKRDPNVMGSLKNDCKTSVDVIVTIYKLIQKQAQKMADCEKMN